MPGLAENDSSAKLFDVPFVGEEKEPSGTVDFYGIHTFFNSGCSKDTVSMV